ncbi:MAG TPA: DUF2232 domain-containing protein [Anaerovoracaceae bacterium]|nr:DUF2232 domain-containing protein [Anaerovoracaceae bacterium]
MLTLIILLLMILIPVPAMLRYMLFGRNAYRGILEGSLSAVTGVAFAFLIYWSVTGATIFDAINSSLNRISIEDMNMGAYTMLGAEPLQPDTMQLMLDNMKETTKLAVPGLLIIFCMIVAYVDYALISRVLSKSGKKISALPPLRVFSLPKNIVIGSLIVYILAYLTVNLGIIDGSLMMYNLEMLFTFIFSIQGLAVIFYFGFLKRIPKFLVVILSGVFFLTWFGQTFLFLLGLIDVVLDIRKRISQTNIKI